MSTVFNLSNLDMATKSYIYKDTTFLNISKNDDKYLIAQAEDILAIYNSIRNIFRFNIGDRILKPEFGNVLKRYLYEAMTDMLYKKITTEIKALFARWEPRVNISYIDVLPHPDINQLDINIIYTIPSLSDITEYTYNTIIKEENY